MEISNPWNKRDRLIIQVLIKENLSILTKEAEDFKEINKISHYYKNSENITLCYRFRSKTDNINYEYKLSKKVINDLNRIEKFYLVFLLDNASNFFIFPSNILKPFLKIPKYLVVRINNRNGLWKFKVAKKELNCSSYYKNISIFSIKHATNDIFSFTNKFPYESLIFFKTIRNEIISKLSGLGHKITENYSEEEYSIQANNIIIVFYYKDGLFIKINHIHFEKIESETDTNAIIQKFQKELFTI